MLENLKQKFEEVYSRKVENIYFAPGRVNLIGEHTDYNGGNVFPCAIDRGTTLLASRRNDKKCRFFSLNFEDKGIVEFSLENLKYEKDHGWTNYPKGIFKSFLDRGLNIEYGFDVLIYGNIPNGAGLSSSASIELVVGILINSEFNFGLDNITLALIGKETENKFIGVNSGIMDQFAIAMGQKDKAILLDCNTLKYEMVPIVLNDEYIVISNTNKKRGLADSKYNERRSECEKGLEELQVKLNINSLGELSIEEFEANKELIKSEVVRRRVKHAVYENQRTIMAKEALVNGDLEKFGEYMNQSHISLRDDYEVTGFELDSLVEAQWQQEGVLGARMTGAGFGGCTVALVKKDKVDNFIKNVEKIYFEKTGLKAEFYIANVSAGVRKL